MEGECSPHDTQELARDRESVHALVNVIGAPGAAADSGLNVQNEGLSLVSRIVAQLVYKSD